MWGGEKYLCGWIYFLEAALMITSAGAKTRTRPECFPTGKLSPEGSLVRPQAVQEGGGGAEVSGTPGKGEAPASWADLAKRPLPRPRR